jgi:hypothetical protein
VIVTGGQPLMTSGRICVRFKGEKATEAIAIAAANAAGITPPGQTPGDGHAYVDVITVDDGSEADDEWQQQMHAKIVEVMEQVGYALQ